MIWILIWEEGARVCLYRLLQSAGAARERRETLFREGLRELIWHTASTNAGEEQP